MFQSSSLRGKLNKKSWKSELPKHEINNKQQMINQYTIDLKHKLLK